MAGWGPETRLLIAPSERTQGEDRRQLLAVFHQVSLGPHNQVTNSNPQTCNPHCSALTQTGISTHYIPLRKPQNRACKPLVPGCRPVGTRRRPHALYCD